MSSLIPALQAMAQGEVQLAPGQTLFCTGEPVRNIYVVLEGSMRLVRHRPSGASVVLQRARAGELLAEASLFASRYHCDAVSDQGARLARIAKARIMQVQREDAAWWSGLAAHLAGEVQRARGRAELLALRTVRERLDAWRALYGELPPRGRWVEVAQEIGVSPEAMYRELARAASNGRMAE